MDAPKCRICGERHWGLCPKNSDGGVEGHASTPPRIADIGGMKPRDGRIVKRASIKAGLSEAKFDRVAYQREYMRKRRAAKTKAPKATES